MSGRGQREIGEIEREMAAWNGNINVRSFFPLLAQPFPSYNSTHLPLNLPLLLLFHLLLPFTIYPPFLTSLHLPGVKLVVILLSETEGRGTHGDAGFSVITVSMPIMNGAKTRKCVCTWTYTGVYRCGHERASF